MPRVLLFDCDMSVVEELAGRSGWTVAIGEHVDESPGGLPDPRQWDLIVDDCEKSDNTLVFPEDAEKLDVLKIAADSTYMRECTSAHGLRFCATESHHGHYLAGPRGHVSQEFHTADDTAALLVDFVESFESRFRRGHLEHEYDPQYQSQNEVDRRLLRRSLFQDAYHERLIEICAGWRLDWLYCIDLVSAEDRVKAILYLITRTIPKLWPEVYSDTFQPRRVVALLKRRAEVIAQRRQEVEEVERAIQEELAFYAPYTAMTVTGNDALKDLVAKALAEVFGCEVIDLDATLEEGEQKTVDLLIREGDSSWFCEVRSRGDGNLRETDLERFDANHGRATERHGSADHRLLIFNGMYRQPSNQRAKYPPFGSERVVQEATDRGITLLATQQLLTSIEAVRNGDLASGQFFQRLMRPGVAGLPTSFGG